MPALRTILVGVGTVAAIGALYIAGYVNQFPREFRPLLDAQVISQPITSLVLALTLASFTGRAAVFLKQRFYARNASLGLSASFAHSRLRATLSLIINALIGLLFLTTLVVVHFGSLMFVVRSGLIIWIPFVFIFAAAALDEEKSEQKAKEVLFSRVPSLPISPNILLGLVLGVAAFFYTLGAHKFHADAVHSSAAVILDSEEVLLFLTASREGVFAFEIPRTEKCSSQIDVAFIPLDKVARIQRVGMQSVGQVVACLI